MIKLIVTLTIVCAVAALVLGITYTATKPLITGQEISEKKEALESVLPGADKYEQKTIAGKQYYEGYKGSLLVGYALSIEGDGYAGKIEMLVGVDQKGKIRGLEVLSQDETPGLGARCIEVKRGDKNPWFLKQFTSKHASTLSLNNIEAITGATITSEAIIEAVKNQVESFFKSISSKG